MATRSWNKLSETACCVSEGRELDDRSVRLDRAVARTGA